MVDRKDCPMRHENGNCLPCGGFCTAVSDPICEALHNAFEHGKCWAKAWETSALAVPVVHAEWISSRFNDNNGYYEEMCSHCSNWSTAYDKPYCPVCGAKMDA